MPNVGEITKVIAWKNTMGPEPPTLHVIGKIFAPTPCHEVRCVYVGDDKTNPPVYILELRFVAPPARCATVIWEKEFQYEQQNFAGVHQEVEVRSTLVSVRAAIQTVS